MSELYRHDQAAFRQYLPWVREVDPTFVPKHSSKLQIASRILGYENAESVASVYRTMRAWLGATAGPSYKPAAGPVG